MDFELRCSILGHRQDVRAICSTPLGNLLSGSRDCTAKLWTSNNNERGFNFNHTYEGHTNFVGAVCAITIGAGKTFVITGSNDKLIRVYRESESKPVNVLKGHTDTVCCLTASIISGSILSASWDKTAALWNLFDGSKEPLTVMVGHEQTVWAVLQMPSGLIVTASGDKKVNLWEPGGALLHTLNGHSDCVRGLCCFSETQVLSCSNDACVKRWDTEMFTCLSTYYGHDNYIYSVDAIVNANLFVSCGEDACFKVWSNDVCIQSVNLPCESAWCIKCLPNGDVAVGSSDGAIRIFTRSPERRASHDERVMFDIDVATSAAKAARRGGDIDIEKIPGMEALCTAGTRNGQTKMIKENGTVYCYKWSTTDKTWENMGQVVGANSKSQKETFNGQDYDYVFRIDVEEGKPPLKLPFNVGDDPWVAAHNFIEEHNLSSLYLEQVANFIVKNSGYTSSSKQRGASAMKDDGDKSVSRVDMKGGKETTESSEMGGTHSSQFFPLEICVAFNVYNRALIEAKLSSNNEQLGPERLEPDHFAQVMMLLDEKLSGEVQINALMKMMHWPNDLIVPALDLLRVAIRSRPIYQKLFSINEGREVMEVIKRCMQSYSSEVLCVLALRTICNLMTHMEGRVMYLKEIDAIINAIHRYNKPFSKHLELAVVTTLLNLSVAANHEKDVAALAKITQIVLQLMPYLKETEATFRALTTLGTCLCDFNDELLEEPMLLVTTNTAAMKAITYMASAGGAPSSASDEKHENLEKLQQCAEQLLEKLHMNA